MKAKRKPEFNHIQSGITFAKDIFTNKNNWMQINKHNLKKKLVPYQLDLKVSVHTNIRISNIQHRVT